MKYHDSICNCHSFFKKICPHHLQFNIAITYFIFQGSKRFLSKTKFFWKNSIHELDSISRMLVFSFLSYFLLMKRKIKINRNRSILCTKYFLSLSSREYFLFPLIPIVEIDSLLETFDEWSKVTTWNREGEGWTNLGTRILCVRFANPSWRFVSVEPSKRQKRTKWRNKFRSGPKWETRVPLLGHYRPEYSPHPLPPHSTMRDVILFWFNFPRFASIPKIFLSFLHHSFFFIFKKNSLDTLLIFFLAIHSSVMLIQKEKKINSSIFF